MAEKWLDLGDKMIPYEEIVDLREYYEHRPAVQCDCGYYITINNLFAEVIHRSRSGLNCMLKGREGFHPIIFMN